MLLFRFTPFWFHLHPGVLRIPILFRKEFLKFWWSHLCVWSSCSVKLKYWWSRLCVGRCCSYFVGCMHLSFFFLHFLCRFLENLNSKMVKTFSGRTLNYRRKLFRKNNCEIPEQLIPEVVSGRSCSRSSTMNFWKYLFRKLICQLPKEIFGTTSFGISMLFFRKQFFCNVSFLNFFGILF